MAEKQGASKHVKSKNVTTMTREPVPFAELKIGKLTYNYVGNGTMMVKLGDGEDWMLLADADVGRLLEFLKEYQALTRSSREQ